MKLNAARAFNYSSSSRLYVDAILVFISRCHYRALLDGSNHEVNYTMTIKEDKCATSIDVLSIERVPELGVTSITLQPNASQEAEFWQGKATVPLQPN